MGFIITIISVLPTWYLYPKMQKIIPHLQSAKVTSLLRQLHDTRAQLAQYINKQRATEQLLASSQQEVKAVRALSAVQLQDLERRHREERDADRREFEAEVELRVRQRWEREGGGRRSRRARNPEEDFEVVQGPPGSPPRRRRRKSRIMPGTIQVEEEEVVEKNVKGIGAGLGVEIKGEEDGGVIESLTVGFELYLYTFFPTFVVDMCSYSNEILTLLYAISITVQPHRSLLDRNPTHYRLPIRTIQTCNCRSGSRIRIGRALILVLRRCPPQK